MARIRPIQLSLADRLCLVLARSLTSHAYTTDELSEPWVSDFSVHVLTVLEPASLPARVAVGDRRGGGRDMTAKRSGWVAGLGAAAAGAAVFIAHQAGVFADDAARVLPEVGHAAGAGAGVVDVLRDPAVSGALKQSVATFRDLRKGTDEEIVVARAGCAVMNSGVAGTLNQTGYEQRIRASLPEEYVQGPQSFLVDRYVERAANALTVANLNGGAGRWYVQYCVFKP